jgi:aminoglycoside phosphotransferase (APT) family kinase protein
MHANEFPIDEKLVRKLIARQFPKWAHLPLKAVPSAGTDNGLYRLGADRVVRLPRIDWAVENIELEYAWLPKIAAYLPVPIPTPLAKGEPDEEFPWPWSIYSWLEGSHPLVGDVPDSFLEGLIAFIQALHKINLSAPAASRGGPLAARDDEIRCAIGQLEGLIDTKGVTKLWDKVIEVPNWEKPPVFVHGDLSSGNVLINKGLLSGVIDFGMLGTGDPACDLIIAWNLLPAPMREAFRKGLGVDDATWERGCGWALSCALVALPYYKETNLTLASSARHVIKELLRENQNSKS